MDTYLKLKDKPRLHQTTFSFSFLLWILAPWSVALLQSMAQLVLSWSEPNSVTPNGLCIIEDLNFALLTAFFSFFIPATVSISFDLLCSRLLKSFNSVIKPTRIKCNSMNDSFRSLKDKNENKSHKENCNENKTHTTLFSRSPSSSTLESFFSNEEDDSCQLNETFPSKIFSSISPTFNQINNNKKLTKCQTNNSSNNNNNINNETKNMLTNGFSDFTKRNQSMGLKSDPLLTLKTNKTLCAIKQLKNSWFSKKNISDKSQLKSAPIKLKLFQRSSREDFVFMTLSRWLLLCALLSWFPLTSFNIFYSASTKFKHFTGPLHQSLTRWPAYSTMFIFPIVCLTRSSILKKSFNKYLNSFKKIFISRKQQT